MDTRRPAHRDWSELLFTAGLVAIFAWYVFDAYSASSRAKNIILIMPIGIIAGLLACGLLAAKAIELARAGSAPIDADRTRAGKSAWSKEALQTLAVTILFALYCIFVDVSGFDVATFVFVGLSLLVLEERNKAVLLLYPAIFTIVALKMVAITSYDIPVVFEVMGR